MGIGASVAHHRTPTQRAGPGPPLGWWVRLGRARVPPPPKTKGGVGPGRAVFPEFLCGSLDGNAKLPIFHLINVRGQGLDFVVKAREAREIDVAGRFDHLP